MSWLFFALLAPLFYSITNYIEKFLIEKRVKDPIFILVIAGVITFCIGIVIAIIHTIPIVSLPQFILLTFSGLFFMFYIIPYFKALSVDEASRVVPFFQFIPLFVLVLSQIFLKETITSKQLVGFFIIIIGGFILGVEKIEKKIFKLRPSFLYMVLSSLLFATGSILFKYVVVSLDYWTTFAYQSFPWIIGSVLLLLYRPYRKSTYKELHNIQISTLIFIILTVLITLLADIATTYAFSLAPTSLVTVVGGIQPLFTLLFGITLSLWFPHILKEDLSKENIWIKFFSIFIIIIGIYFINL